LIQPGKSIMTAPPNRLAHRADEIYANYISACSSDQLLAALSEATAMARTMAQIFGIDVTCPPAFADHVDLAQAWSDGLGASALISPALTAAAVTARAYGLQIIQITDKEKLE
jgi:hypothetical protein